VRRFELVERRRIELRTAVPIPDPGPREVLIRVKACTVCGRSDLVYFHYLGVREHCALGCFGHEIAGVVEAIGTGTVAVRVGDRVFVRTPITSGFADFALAREIAVGRLPEAIPFEQGAILQLLPLAVHATRGVRLGDRVLVVGQGPVGLMALQVARLRGASFVAVADLDPWRLERSTLLGADETLDVSRAPLAELLTNARLADFDVAIEAVGTPKTVDEVTRAVRVAGLVVLLGTHHVESRVPFDLIHLEKRGLRIDTAAEPTDVTRVAALQVAERLAGQGKVQLEPLLSHTYPLTALPTAIERLSQNGLLAPSGEPGVPPGPPPKMLKVAIIP
jgi:threonine dehydrogenase-like Zn-dependent dehydrogenase